jgi:hypothetical protein
MSVRAATVPTALPRPWVPPTLTEHADLIVMARTLAKAFGSIALLQISQSCVTNPASCGQ